MLRILFFRSILAIPFILLILFSYLQINGLKCSPV